MIRLIYCNRNGGGDFRVWARCRRVDFFFYSFAFEHAQQNCAQNISRLAALVGMGARTLSLFLAAIELDWGGGHKNWEVFRGAVGEGFFLQILLI
jgi:hypothetical protein